MSRDQHDADDSDDVRSRGSSTVSSSTADSDVDDTDTADSDAEFESHEADEQPASHEADEQPASHEADDRPGPRDVVVPMEVYKVVTVFSTLIAVPAVVLGFMFLDAATLQVSFMRSIVLLLLSAVGLVPDPAVLSAVLAIVGLLLIAFGAGVYVLGARFRAEGMGNAEEDTNEQSTNG